MEQDLDLELGDKATPKNDLNFKIKQVSEQISKKEKELKLLREKLIYLKCNQIEEKVHKKSLENNRSNKTLISKSTSSITTLGNEQMRSFML